MKLKMLRPFWLKQSSLAQDSENKEGSLARLAKYAKEHSTLFRKKSAKETEKSGDETVVPVLNAQFEDPFQQDAVFIPVQDEESLRVSGGSIENSTRYKNTGITSVGGDASHSPLLGKPYWEHLVESLLDNKEDVQNTRVSAIADATSSITTHSRQLSASSTLLASLRSHASEPLLRDKARVEASMAAKVKPSEVFFFQHKELKDFTKEKAWNLILASQEVAHRNQLTDLKEEHEHIVEELREGLLAAENQVKLSEEQKLCLQKQVNKEASAKLAALKEYEVLKEKLAQVEANNTAMVSSLTDEKVQLLNLVSDLEAREASYQKVICAAAESNAKLMQEVASMKGAVSRAKREFDHSKFKLWELQRALDGKPMLDKVDQQVTIDYQVNQIKQLISNSILLSTELEEMEVEVARREAATRTELEEMAEKLVQANSAKEIMEKKLAIVHGAYEALLSQPRSWFRCSTDEQIQTISGCFEALRKECEVLRSAITTCQIKEAAAEEDRSIWQFRYRGLREEMSMKQKEFNELEEAVRVKDCSLVTMSIELEAITREKIAEVDYKTKEIALLEKKVAGLSEHIDLLGRQEVSAQTDWCLDFKAAQIAQLQHSLQQANEYIKKLHSYVQETEYTVRLDKELEEHTDAVINDLKYNLYHTEVECTQLRAENTALRAELKGCDGGRGLRNAFQVEQQVQEGTISSVGHSSNDSLREALINHKSAATAFKDTLRGIPTSAASEVRALYEEADRRMVSNAPSLSTKATPASKAVASHNYGLRKCSGEMNTGKVAGTLRRVAGELAMFGQYVTTDRKGSGKTGGEYETLSGEGEYCGYPEGCYEDYFEDIKEVDESLSLAERSNLHKATAGSVIPYERLTKDYEHSMHETESQTSEVEFLPPQVGCCSTYTQTQCAGPSREAAHV